LREAFFEYTINLLVGWPASILIDLSFYFGEFPVGTKRTGKGRRKIGRKKRRMRAKIRHRKK
tara:strand:- start:2024 stop:2209 length:186 start_codon:yes stop_codon:yes gene_type:complete